MLPDVGAVELKTKLVAGVEHEARGIAVDAAIGNDAVSNERERYLNAASGVVEFCAVDEGDLTAIGIDPDGEAAQGLIPENDGGDFVDFLRSCVDDIKGLVVQDETANPNRIDLRSLGGDGSSASVKWLCIAVEVQAELACCIVGD